MSRTTYPDKLIVTTDKFLQDIYANKFSASSRSFFMRNKHEGFYEGLWPDWDNKGMFLDLFLVWMLGGPYCCASDNNLMRIPWISKHKEQSQTAQNNHQRESTAQTNNVTRFSLNAYVLGAIQKRD